jgi:putative membrane protein
MLVIWIGILIATPIAIWIVGDGIFALLASLGVIAQFSLVSVLLVHNWGARRGMISILTVSMLTYAIELVGSKTGFPFGWYAYSEALQPQFGGVPLLIPLAWLMMIAPAWSVADTLLRRSTDRLGRWHQPLLWGLSSLAFTAWDLYLDPQMVERGLWTWHQPGAYFSIPWVNYLGWFGSSFVITMLVRPQNLPRYPLLYIYALTWLFQAIGLGLFWGQPGPALVGFICMGIFVILAFKEEQIVITRDVFEAYKGLVRGAYTIFYNSVFKE